MLLRSVLEYCSSVWDPYTQSNQIKLERVQRRAARWVSNQFKLEASATEILSKLEWVPLEERRAKSKVLIFHKAMYREIEIPMGEVNINNNKTRSQGTNIRVPQSRTNAHLHSFYPSTIRLWNSMPIKLKCITEPDLLKNKLKEFTLRSHYHSYMGSFDRSGYSQIKFQNTTNTWGLHFLSNDLVF